MSKLSGVNKMSVLQLLNLSITKDKMKAYVELNKEKLELLKQQDVLDEMMSTLNKEQVLEWLNNSNIVYGIQENSVETLVNNFMNLDFPSIIAEGDEPINGEDGYIQYNVAIEIEKLIADDDFVNFKQIMKIPKVEVGEKIASIIPPSDGKDGMNIFGKTVRARKGKEAQIKPGENTKLVDGNIYSTEFGQVSVTDKSINVVRVFEVNRSIDLSTGNIDFNGTVIINGDVPNGYTIKAKEDVQIYGLVEAANIEAGGSITIKEGVSALGKGKIKAGLDIHIGYINQGNLEAGRDIIVNNSIFHSVIVAKERVYCQSGNIIGGNLSAGKEIIGKDFGNRMSTKTVIYLGMEQKILKKHNHYIKEIEEMKGQIEKLKTIGDKIEYIQNKRPLTEKEKLLLNKKEQSLENLSLKLSELYNEYKQLSIKNVDENDSLNLVARGTIYPNVDIIVGKYSYSIKEEHQNVSVLFLNGDFHLVPY